MANQHYSAEISRIVKLIRFYNRVGRKQHDWNLCQVNCEKSIKSYQPKI